MDQHNTRALAALPVSHIAARTRLMDARTRIVTTANLALAQDSVRKAYSVQQQGAMVFPQFLLGADVLIHPAYRENTGITVLESTVAGLPVLTTAVCGCNTITCATTLAAWWLMNLLQTALNDALKICCRMMRSAVALNHGLMAEAADIYSLFDRAAGFCIAAAGKEKHMKLFLNPGGKNIGGSKDPFAELPILRRGRGVIAVKADAQCALRKFIAVIFSSYTKGIGWKEILEIYCGAFASVECCQ